jgi:hypothetical protein
MNKLRSFTYARLNFSIRTNQPYDGASTSVEFIPEREARQVMSEDG